MLPKKFISHYFYKQSPKFNDTNHNKQVKSNHHKILVMSLGRGGGCSQYTFCVLKHFTLPYTLYQTKYAIEDIQENAIKVTTYKNNKFSFLVNSIFVLPILFLGIYSKAKHYDVLFLPYFHFWNLAFIVAFKLRKKKIVIVEHDGVVHIGEEYPFQQILVNACLKNANEIIFLSDFVRTRVSKSLIKNKPTHIIPHGLYELDYLQTTPKIYNPKPNILFFGRINPYKGLQNLIDAVAMLAQDSYDKLIIAGKSTITYDISKLPKHKIEIHDNFLSKNEIAMIFNKSHILVLPYLEASQSGVIAIGIANNIPIICTNVGGLKEQLSLGVKVNSHDDTINIVKCNDCAIFCESTPKDISDKIRILIDDKALYHSLTTNLHTKASEIKWEYIAKNIQEVLRKS